MVDSIEQLLLLQATLHQIYCGTSQSPEELIDLLEHGKLYPPVDVCVDARAVFDAVAASDVCDPSESSLKLHLISVRGRIACGIIRFLWWIDTRDMAADGLTKSGIDRTILHNLSQEYLFDCKHDVLRHPKTSSSSGLPVSQLTTKGDNISQSNTTTSTFQRSSIHGYKKPNKVYWSDEGLNF